MAKVGFDLNKFFNESMTTLVSPKKYFSSMSKTGELLDSILKVVIYGLISGIISYIWSLLKVGRFAGVLGNSVGAGTIILSPIYSIIGLFIGGVILLILSAICSGSTKFDINLKVTAALMVIMPVQTLVQLFFVLGMSIGNIIGLLVSLYGLWMLFNGLVGALSAKRNIAQIVVGIIAILLIMATFYRG